MDAIRINRKAARLAALLLLGLALMGCNAKRPASTFARPVAAAPAPRTLESTLRLHPDAQEIPFNPQIAGDAYGNAVAVWEQFDGTHDSIWGNDRAPVRGRRPCHGGVETGGRLAHYHMGQALPGARRLERRQAGVFPNRACACGAPPERRHRPACSRRSGDEALLLKT